MVTGGELPVNGVVEIGSGGTRGLEFGRVVSSGGNGSRSLAENTKSSSHTLGVVHWSKYRLLDSQRSASVAPSRRRLVSSSRTRRPSRLAPRVRVQLRRRLAPSTASETDPK